MSEVDWMPWIFSLNSSGLLAAQRLVAGDQLLLVEPEDDWSKVCIPY